MDIRPDAGPFRLAVDLGTTSIHWRLLDGTGHEAASGQALNPQMGAGSDVVSRLAASRNQEGRERLGHLVIRFLQRVVSDVGVPVAELCIAGNTAMTSILLNEDVAGLCAAPYRLTEPGGRTAELPGLPPAWIPPQPAPFVGGDISAGMAALLYGESPEFPFLLADMGTNGEFVLALDKERSFIASVPLGPSLEGIGLRYGGVADTGSVSGFRLGPFGLSPVVIGNTEPKRICGTGYLSLLDALLRTGFLDATGRLASAPVSPLAARLLGTVERGAAGWSLPLPGGMELAGADVEEILKVKAAFSLALESLLAASGLESRALARVCLGGALGEHMPETALERLGFLPGDLQNKVDPYLRPLYDGLFDLLGAETFQKLFEKQVIEVAPLAYMRGRTLDDAFIILDEAQNTTPEQMKMFLTRMGVGSKVVVTGDVTQIDLPDKVRSGLIDALHVLRDVEGIAQVRLTEKDVVRHRLVQQIVKAYEKAAEEKAPGSHNHKQTMEVD